MARLIHRDATAAWRHLIEQGGLELDDRDEAIERKLAFRLNPRAENLEAALMTSTVDALVHAFFEVIHPFVHMFRDTLQYFERAGATEGRDQWNLQVNDVPLDLEHFRQFLEQWDRVDAEFDVPAVDWRATWAIHEVTRDIPSMMELRLGTSVTGVPDVDRWLSAYRGGKYQPLPRSLAPNRLPPGLADSAAIAAAALSIIREGTDDRQELLSQARSAGFSRNPSDGLAWNSIAGNETDYWLETVVLRITHALTLGTDGLAVGEKLQSIYAMYPRKKVGVHLDAAVLTSILALPIWKKRHELYAVWIATQILSALDDHDVEIHHDNSRITFAFRETKLATVTSARPEVLLIGERRVKLDQPVGKGRTANVQPDFGLWRRTSTETCGLVVEVKHYKKAAPRSFGDVLTDYARAFPDAQVYLVNHGPVGSVWDSVPRELMGRCGVIEHLTVEHAEARGTLRKAVREYVGSPVRRDPLSTSDAILAIDNSASMVPHLRSPGFLDFLGKLVGGRCREAALIDTRVQDIIPIDALGEALRSRSGIGTDLEGPLRELLHTYPRVILVTDDEGQRSLRDLGGSVIDHEATGIIVMQIE